MRRLVGAIQACRINRFLQENASLVLHHPLHDHPPRPRRGFSLPGTGLRLLAPPRTAGMGGKRTLRKESGDSPTPMHWPRGRKAGATRAGTSPLRCIGHVVTRHTQRERGLSHPVALATWSQGRRKESGDSTTPLHWPCGCKANATRAGAPQLRCIGHVVARHTQRERGLPWRESPLSLVSYCWRRFTASASPRPP